MTRHDQITNATHPEGSSAPQDAPAIPGQVQDQPQGQVGANRLDARQEDGDPPAEGVTMTETTTDQILMTNKELDRLAADLPHVKAWVSAVENELVAQLEAGVDFHNVKLVPKRATRKWLESIDPIALLRKFSKLDIVAPRKPLSPSEAEKTLGKKLYRDKLAESVSAVSSGMKLAYCNEEELED
jgi:hypothetical protein